MLQEMRPRHFMCEHVRPSTTLNNPRSNWKEIYGNLLFFLPRADKWAWQWAGGHLGTEHQNIAPWHGLTVPAPKLVAKVRTRRKQIFWDKPQCFEDQSPRSHFSLFWCSTAAAWVPWLWLVLLPAPAAAWCANEHPVSSSSSSSQGLANYWIAWSACTKDDRIGPTKWKSVSLQAGFPSFGGQGTQTSCCSLAAQWPYGNAAHDAAEPTPRPYFQQSHWTVEFFRARGCHESHAWHCCGNAPMNSEISIMNMVAQRIPMRHFGAEARRWASRGHLPASWCHGKEKASNPKLQLGMPFAWIWSGLHTNGQTDPERGGPKALATGGWMCSKQASHRMLCRSDWKERSRPCPKIFLPPQLLASQPTSPTWTSNRASSWLLNDTLCQACGSMRKSS